MYYRAKKRIRQIYDLSTRRRILVIAKYTALWISIIFPGNNTQNQIIDYFILFNAFFNISDTKHPNHDSLAAIKEKILSKRSLIIFSFTAQ